MKLWKRIASFAAASVTAAVILTAIWAYEPDLPVAEARLKYAQPPSRFIDMLGMSVHLRDQGDPNDSLPLVLLHGTSSSLHTWELLRKRIGEGRRVVTVDLPAFGLTGPSPENRYSYDTYTLFLDSLLNRLDIDSCILGGNSLGGGIAWNYAVDRPGRVARLILFDATGYPKTNESGSLGFKLAAMPGVGRLLLWFTPRTLVRKSLEQAYADPGVVTEDMVTRYHDLILVEGNRRATLSLFQNPLRPDPARIRQVRMPALVIWGEHDRLIGKEKAALFGADIPGSRVVVLKNSGHVPMEESPDAVAEVLIPFIRYR